MQSPLAGNSYISNKADCRRAINCVTPVTPELDRGLPAWRWIRRSKYGKSVAVLGAGLVGEQEREVSGRWKSATGGLRGAGCLGPMVAALPGLPGRKSPGPPAGTTSAISKNSCGRCGNWRSAFKPMAKKWKKEVRNEDVFVG
jgi:hypothetical protein